MYTYGTLEELVDLLDKHFENTERFRFDYHVKDHKFYYTFTVDGNTVYEGNLTLDDVSIRSYNLPNDCCDWFRDQWYDFRRNDIPQPPETGKDITLSDHVIVTDPCYETEDTQSNGQLTNVRPGVYHTKATYADINGWGRRCTSLILWHESVDEPTEYEHTDIPVDVDSGQAGVVDFPYFKGLEKDADTKERWYDNINTATYVRKPISEALMSVIQEGEELHKQAVEALSNYFEAKENNDSESAAAFFIEYNDANFELQKLLRENGFDTQSLYDHKTTPMFAYALWTDKHAAITGSGLGDGSYDCFIAKDGDQIVGIKLDYFYDEDEDQPMIDFTTVTKDICIFYLGGIAGDEGPILNILKTSDNRYYFNYWVYDTVFYEDDKAINITKETTLDTIKRLFSEENLRSKDLYLYDIFDPKDGQVFYETTDRTYEPTNNEAVKERFEATINNYEFLGVLNWHYDNKELADILPFILNQLESED